MKIIRSTAAAAAAAENEPCKIGLLSVYRSPRYLQLLPMAVLYGVFLFMGITSMPGNELFERLELFFIWETKKMPAYSYVGKASTQRMHFFTFLQAVCLAILSRRAAACGRAELLAKKKAH